MEEKKKTSCSVVIVIILMLMVLGLGGYITYDKVLSNKDTESASNDTEKEKDDASISEAEVLNYYNNLVHYKNTIENSNIHKIDLGGEGTIYDYRKSLYSNQKVILENIFSYDDKMVMSYKRLNENQINITSKNLSDGNYEETKKFLVSDIEKAYKEYFGESSVFKSESFEKYGIGNCKVEKEYYICTILGGYGGITDSSSLLTSFNKYEVKDDMLYIYEYAIYNGKTDQFDNNYYLDSNFSNEVVEFRSKIPEQVLNTKNQDKLLIYKHTLKQNTDGTYYWYSVEPVK